MDGIHNKGERIKEALRQFLNFFFFPFPMGDALFEFAKYIRDKIRRQRGGKKIFNPPDIGYF
jgi:hypothetical protein